MSRERDRRDREKERERDGAAGAGATTAGRDREYERDRERDNKYTRSSGAIDRERSRERERERDRERERERERERDRERESLTLRERERDRDRDRYAPSRSSGLASSVGHSNAFSFGYPPPFIYPGAGPSGPGHQSLGPSHHHRDNHSNSNYRDERERPKRPSEVIFRCMAVLSQTTCNLKPGSKECRFRHELPAAESMNELKCTKLGSVHFVDVYCLKCDQKLLSSHQISQIRKNHFWMCTPQSDNPVLHQAPPVGAMALNTRPVPLIGPKKEEPWQTRPEFGPHCRSINVVCNRCHLAVGCFYAHHNQLGNCFRINYIREKTGLNSCYLVPMSSFTLAEALERHTLLFKDNKPFPRMKGVPVEKEDPVNEDSSKDAENAANKKRRSPSTSTGLVGNAASVLQYPSTMVQCLDILRQQPSAQVPTAVDALLVLLQTSVINAVSDEDGRDNLPIRQACTKISQRISSLRDNFDFFTSCRQCNERMDQEDGHHLLPCRHSGFCKACGEKVVNNSRLCPVCNQDVAAMELHIQTNDNKDWAQNSFDSATSNHNSENNNIDTDTHIHDHVVENESHLYDRTLDEEDRRR